MVQRDYILRMIEEMGELVLALRKKILGGGSSMQDVRDDIAAVSHRASVDLELIRELSAESITMLVAPTGELDPVRCWLVAEMLYLDGLQAEAEGRKVDAVDRFRKALPLYSVLAPGALHLELPEALERLTEIEERLEQLAVA